MTDFADRPRIPAARTGTARSRSNRSAPHVPRPPWAPVQRMERGRSASAREESGPVPGPNRTGLPDRLKAGVEALSGLPMDDVRVHRNSAEPAKLGALAYAKGSDIHLGPGQEQHLPHEAWHVVQQKQGRVKATALLKGGAALNDDVGLEREADAMGGRASGSASPSSRIPPAAAFSRGKGAGEPVQLLAAVNGPAITLEQGGGAGKPVIMENKIDGIGNQPANTVGFTGVLNAGTWAGLGKSPTDYMRAHGYAKMFGGAGDSTNVGWWPQVTEDRWGPLEIKVRGAKGSTQVAAYRPGDGEKGNYLVNRELHKKVDLATGYLKPLLAAGEWGFDDARPAWTRALATCQNKDAKARLARIAALTAAKSKAKAKFGPKAGIWLGDLFGNNTLETHLIAKLIMEYSIVTHGANEGPERGKLAAFKNSVSAPAPKPAEFGLENRPADIWGELLNGNVGQFAEGNPWMSGLNALVPYPGIDPTNKDAAQQFTSYSDGWGVE